MDSDKARDAPDTRVYAETLKPVEPDNGIEQTPPPFSLTDAELGRLLATVATEPVDVFAWVRYPAVSVNVQGRALAWTARAVYIEWDHRGTHRAWVWASAVQRGGLSG
ncbi:hypothetical protein [Cryobacterium zhongshanensis]|uniref:Uncharacterized protein n=1 Tax=Cryobacterium zhongshanensis TaxID=2928153 RepID=A0AA41QXX8_9MICO|nr:hypothetical protein [Cryobacterium zhongshanensis]MCI4659741.1 hypothetical protein [Cryobacterium zhongshanensis]